jgi:hypothetical protein
VTAYLQRGLGPAQAAQIVAYLKTAGTPVRRLAGGGSFVFGSPVHLAVLVEFAAMVPVRG